MTTFTYNVWNMFLVKSIRSTGKTVHVFLYPRVHFSSNHLSRSPSFFFFALNFPVIHFFPQNTSFFLFSILS